MAHRYRTYSHSILYRSAHFGDSVTCAFALVLPPKEERVLGHGDPRMNMVFKILFTVVFVAAVITLRVMTATGRSARAEPATPKR
jgi:hypothetical protein